MAGVEALVAMEELDGRSREVHDEVGDDGWQRDVCWFLCDGRDGLGARRTLGCYCCALAAEGGGKHVVGCLVDECAAILVKGTNVLPDLYLSAAVAPASCGRQLTLFFWMAVSRYLKL